MVDKFCQRVVPIVSNPAAVATDRDPGSERDDIGERFAAVAVGVATAGESVGPRSTEHDLAGAAEELCSAKVHLARCRPVTVADPYRRVVERQPIDDRDVCVSSQIEVASGGDAVERAAARRHHECRAVGADESGAYDRATEENDIARGVDLRDIRDAGERDRGACAGRADDGRVNGRWQDISIPIDGIEEVRPRAVSTAVPGDDRQHGTPLEPLHADKRPLPDSARGNTMLDSASAAPPREKSSEERPRARKTAHRRNPDGRAEKDPERKKNQLPRWQSKRVRQHVQRVVPKAEENLRNPVPYVDQEGEADRLAIASDQSAIPRPSCRASAQPSAKTRRSPAREPDAHPRKVFLPPHPSVKGRGCGSLLRGDVENSRKAEAWQQ